MFGGRLGPFELIVILAIVVMIFGAGRLAGLGKSLGTSLREFKESLRGEPKETPTGDNAEQK